MLYIPEMRAALEFMLEYCDIFLPSGPELVLLTEADEEDKAIEEIHAMGVSKIVIKRGAQGSSYYDAERQLHCPGLKVPEIDPTGAGDCFGATFVTCWLRGMPVEDCLRYANASGARAVTVKGPMEGVSTWAELNALLNRSGGKAV
jgi:sugar/nucleoside kinase (ribokinase family)